MKYKKSRKKRSDSYYQGLYTHLGRCLAKDMEREMRNITSTDPRKHLIMRALKIKSGGTKVTCVVEVSPGIFQGHCQKRQFTTDGAGFAHPTGGYETLGDFTVTAQEAGIR